MIFLAQTFELVRSMESSRRRYRSSQISKNGHVLGNACVLQQRTDTAAGSDNRQDSPFLPASLAN